MSVSRTFTRRNVLKTGVVATSAAGIVAAISACAPSNNSSNTSGNTSDSGSSTTQEPAGEANTDGTIRAGISYELGTNGFDPMTTTAALTVAANWHTMEGLTELHPATREVFAALADELPESDGTSVEVTLREGAVFHDGSPVTAEDVVFSFERVMNPDNNSLYRQFIPFIDSVTASGENKVTINLKHPTGLLAQRLSVVKIVPKSAVEADQTAFDANPIGTGPWRLTDNGASSRVLKFERNDSYTGPNAARAAKMEWEVLPDGDARQNALTSNTVQAIDSVPYISIDALSATATVESVQGFGLAFAMFNNTAGNPFSDVRNRQAFLHAINYDQVIEVGFMGNASPAKCFVHEAHPAFKEASKQYNYDVEAAKQLFAETGLTEFRLLCTDHGWVQAFTPIIQQNLEAAGVKVSFEEKQSSDVYSTIDGNPEAYDVVVAPGDPSVFGEDADLLMRWWYAGDTWIDQRMHWKGSEAQTALQELLTKGIETTDQAEQTEAWHAAFDLISEEVPLYPLFHRKTPTAYNGETLVDFKPISLTGLSFVNVGTTNA